MLTYQVEPFSSIISEAMPLFLQHWEEIALDKDTTPLKPFWAAYADLEKAGVLHATTARHEGKLVGYSTYIVVKRMLRYDLCCAESDILFLAPEHRKGMAGADLLRFAEDSLRAVGVERVVTKTKLAPEHDLGHLLERLGYEPIERVYAKVI